MVLLIIYLSSWWRKVAAVLARKRDLGKSPWTSCFNGWSGASQAPPKLVPGTNASVLLRYAYFDHHSSSYSNRHCYFIKLKNLVLGNFKGILIYYFQIQNLIHTQFRWVFALSSKRWWRIGPSFFSKFSTMSVVVRNSSSVTCGLTESRYWFRVSFKFGTGKSGNVSSLANVFSTFIFGTGLPKTSSHLVKCWKIGYISYLYRNCGLNLIFDWKR